MVKRSLFIIPFILIGLFGSAYSNLFSMELVKNDLKFIIENNLKDTKSKNEGLKFYTNEVSETKLALKGLIRLYQQYISSQDKPTCMFTLSCSRFGILAIRKYGVIAGGLMISDRLQRCNGFGRTYYPVDPDNKLSIDDPICDYHLGKINK